MLKLSYGDKGTFIDDTLISDKFLDVGKNISDLRIAEDVINQNISSLVRGDNLQSGKGIKLSKTEKFVAISCDIEPVEGREIELKVLDIGNVNGIYWRYVADQYHPAPSDWTLLVALETIRGLKGDKGERGGSVHIVDTLPSTSNLPRPPKNPDDAYIIGLDLYVWMPSYRDWKNVGQIKGDRGERGTQGIQGIQGIQGKVGPKGESGGISSFLLSWVVSTVTNQAISTIRFEVGTMINDAINDAINQLMSQMENMVTDAVESAISDAMKKITNGRTPEISSRKFNGQDAICWRYQMDKDHILPDSWKVLVYKDDIKGKDGTSIRMVNRFDLLTQFITAYPAKEENVGIGAFIGDENATTTELWMIVKSTNGTGITPTYTHAKVMTLTGIKGDKGADAKWDISVRDESFVEKFNLEVVSDLPAGVSGLYIRDTNTISVEGANSSDIDPRQVGFKMHVKLPVPDIREQDDISGQPSTKGKVLSNNGRILEWVDAPSSKANIELLVKSPNRYVWSIRVDDDGRIWTTPSIKQTNNESIPITSPNGKLWLLTCDDSGVLNTFEG